MTYVPGPQVPGIQGIGARSSISGCRDKPGTWAVFAYVPGPQVPGI